MQQQATDLLQHMEKLTGHCCHWQHQLPAQAQPPGQKAQQHCPMQQAALAHPPQPGPSSSCGNDAGIDCAGAGPSGGQLRHHHQAQLHELSAHLQDLVKVTAVLTDFFSLMPPLCQPLLACACAFPFLHSYLLLCHESWPAPCPCPCPSAASLPLAGSCHMDKLHRSNTKKNRNNQVLPELGLKFPDLFQFLGAPGVPLHLLCSSSSL